MINSPGTTHPATPTADIRRRVIASLGTGTSVSAAWRPSRVFAPASSGRRGQLYPAYAPFACAVNRLT